MVTKQKFKRGTRVRIDDDLGPSKSHFPSGREAIVEYTYAQRYPHFGGSDPFCNYCLVLLDGKGNGCDSVSWYHEKEIALVPGHSIKEGLSIIEEYRYG